MAETDMKTISELDSVPDGIVLDSTSIFPIVVNIDSHNTTRKIDFIKLKNQIAPAPWTDIVRVLTAGNTSITISDESILATSNIQVFTDPALLYNSITVDVGSVTLTFDEQQSDVSVKVRVS